MVFSTITGISSIDEAKGYLKRSYDFKNPTFSLGISLSPSQAIKTLGLGKGK